MPDGPSELLVLPDGSSIPFVFKSLNAPGASQATTESDATIRWFPAPDSRTERLPATLVASASVARPCRITNTVFLGDRIALKSGTDMTALGNAIHACIATAFTGQGIPLGEARITRILDGFGLKGAIDPSGLV